MPYFSCVFLYNCKVVGAIPAGGLEIFSKNFHRVQYLFHFRSFKQSKNITLTYTVLWCEVLQTCQNFSSLVFS